MKIKVMRSIKAPERKTTPKFSKWRALFNNMDSGNWFLVDTKVERARVMTAITNHKHKGKFTIYLHPTNLTKSVVLKK